MDKSLLHIIFLILTSFSFGQNLIPNGSFEEYDWCPDYASGFYIEAAKYWSNPTLGTSDYFNACSQEFDSDLGYYLFSVPENYLGYQTARTGNAYAGLLFSQSNNPDLYWLDATYSEYIHVELSQELVSGKLYELTFYVSNPYTDVCSNSVGALFTDYPVNEQHDKMLQFHPQVQSDLNVFFCDSTKWFEIKQTFAANGGERFLTIGVFTPLFVTLTSNYSGNIISGPEPWQYGAIEYLYVDDVSLTESSYQLPNVFTPNNDGVNDVCSFDLMTPVAKQIRVINRWGETVFVSDNFFQWDGKLSSGEDCSDGVYYYSITLKNDKVIQGFISLVR